MSYSAANGSGRCGKPLFASEQREGESVIHRRADEIFTIMIIIQPVAPSRVQLGRAKKEESNLPRLTGLIRFREDGHGAATSFNFGRSGKWLAGLRLGLYSRLDSITETPPALCIARVLPRAETRPVIPSRRTCRWRICRANRSR